MTQRVPEEGVYVTWYTDGSGPTTVHRYLANAVHTAGDGGRHIGFMPWDSEDRPEPVEPV